MAIVGAAMQIAFWTIVVPTALWILIKLFGDFFYGIGTMLFSVMDMLQSTFRKLAGLGTVWVDGKESSDILTAIMKSDVVIDVLISVSVFALGLVILGSIVQMVRLEYTTEGSKNSKEKIFTSALKSLLMFVLIPIVCFVGIRLSNYLLQAVDYATSSTGASTVSGSVFAASTNDASTVYNENNFQSGADLSNLLASIFHGEEYTNAVIKREGNTLYVAHFKDNFSITSTATSGDVTEGERARLTKMVAEAFTKVSIPTDEYWADNGLLLVGTKVTGDFSGTKFAAFDTVNLSYLNTNAVSYFYNTGNINYLLLYVGCYICIKALFNAAMGMIARIYKVVGLFVIAPAAIGLQPIDDGNAYKKWKGSFIQNVLSCYGFIVALNLYFMVVGVLQTVELWSGWGFYLLNSFMQFLFVLTGATMIKDLSGMFAGLIGAADAMADGEKATGEVGKLAGSVAKVGMGAVMGGAAAFKGIGAAAAKFKSVKTADGKGHTSVFKEQGKINASKRADAASAKASAKAAELGKEFDDTYKKDDQGNIVRQDGVAMNKLEQMRANNLASRREKADEKAKDRADTAKEAAKAAKSAQAEFASNDALARQSTKATARGLAAGQAMNRVKSVIKNSGAVGTFKNLTGNIGSYMSGEAYKGDDEKYQETMAKAGVNAKDYGLEVGTTAAAKGLSAATGKVGNALHLQDSTTAIATTDSSAKARIQGKANQEKFKQAYQNAEDNKNQTVAELSSKSSKLDSEMRAMRTNHSAIGSDDWEGSGKQKGRKETYRTADTKDFEKLMKSKDDFLSGSLSGADFQQMVTDALAGNNKNRHQNIDTNNPFFNDMLTEMQQIMSSAGSANAARNAMMQSATLNISDADIKARAHDAINDTAKFGTYNERKDYQDKLGAKKATDEAIGDINDAWDKTAQAYDANLAKAVTDPKAAADALNEAIGDKFKQANEELARKLKNEGIKAQFGENQKFKIEDQPILAALNKLQEEQAKTAQAAKDAAKAGEVSDLLKELIKETKKKK